MSSLLGTLFKELEQYGISKIKIPKDNFKIFQKNKIYLKVIDENNRIIKLHLFCHDEINYIRTPRYDDYFNTIFYTFDEFIDGKSFCLKCLNVLKNIKQLETPIEFAYDTILNDCSIGIISCETHAYLRTQVSKKNDYYFLSIGSIDIDQLIEYINLPVPTNKHFFISM